jgi:prolyl-tRNA synthetase
MFASHARKDIRPVRWSQTFIPTLKETPAEAEVPSHRLMLRAGLVRQLMAGVYTYLPLGLRALHKAERIVREEMDRAGAVELLMPVMQPAQLFHQTGRYDDFGRVLINFHLPRRDSQVHVALGPTHEEVITDLVARHVSSYRQMPLTLYQIQTKFRNEERPRFGVLRTTEFLMKDAYSFDVSLEALNRSYQAMYDAYCRILERCELTYLPVEAESGPIGGEASHEFMVPADNGEDQVVQCTACDYAANRERAEIGAADTPAGDAGQQSLTKVATPGATTIEQVSQLLGCAPAQMIKTLIYVADGKPVAVLVRGDHEANEAKVRRVLGVSTIELADPETISKVTGAPVGFAGPVGIQCHVIADRAVAAVHDAVTGANEADAHYTGVNAGRDFPEPRTADLRYAEAGDPCPRCGAALEIRQGIEVSHVFKLGTKYSEALGANFLDEKEQQHPVIMGCYGMGINRIIAAAIETHHDDDGIIWPVALAPYSVLVLPLNVTDTEVMAAAEDIYKRLGERGIDVLLDDRDARAGFKFKDADLIGFPVRVVIGQRGLKESNVEIKWRNQPDALSVSLTEAVDTVIRELQSNRSEPRASASA